MHGMGGGSGGGGGCPFGFTSPRSVGHDSGGRGGGYGLGDTTQMHQGAPVLSSLPEISFLPDAVLIVDEDGLIVRCNENAQRLFGYPRNELVGLDVTVLVPPQFREGHPEMMAEAFAAMTPKNMSDRKNVQATLKNGKLAEVSIHLAFVYVRDQVITRAVNQPADGAEGAPPMLVESTVLRRAVVCVCRDMRQHNAMVRRRDEAERSRASAEAFLTLVNHEVRTGMHAVLNALASVKRDTAQFIRGAGSAIHPDWLRDSNDDDLDDGGYESDDGGDEGTSVESNLRDEPASAPMWSMSPLQDTNEPPQWPLAHQQQQQQHQQHPPHHPHPARPHLPRAHNTSCSPIDPHSSVSPSFHAPPLLSPTHSDPGTNGLPSISSSTTAAALQSSTSPAAKSTVAAPTLSALATCSPRSAVHSLRMLEAGITHMDVLFRNLLDYRSLSEGALVKREALVDVRNAMDLLKFNHAARWYAKRQRVCIDTHTTSPDASLPLLHVDAMLLTKLLETLFDNAIKHAGSRATVLMSVAEVGIEEPQPEFVPATPAAPTRSLRQPSAAGAGSLGDRQASAAARALRLVQDSRAEQRLQRFLASTPPLQRSEGGSPFADSAAATAAAAGGAVSSQPASTSPHSSFPLTASHSSSTSPFPDFHNPLPQPPSWNDRNPSANSFSFTPPPPPPSSFKHVVLQRIRSKNRNGTGSRLASQSSSGTATPSFSPPATPQASSAFTSPNHPLHFPAQAASMPFERRCFQFIVADTGVGLAQPVMAAMEDETFAADSTSTRATVGGMGLGLQIAKLCAEQLQGQLIISSRIRDSTESSSHSPTSERGANAPPRWQTVVSFTAVFEALTGTRRSNDMTQAGGGHGGGSGSSTAHARGPSDLPLPPRRLPAAIVTGTEPTPPARLSLPPLNFMSPASPLPPLESGLASPATPQPALVLPPSVIMPAASPLLQPHTFEVDTIRQLGQRSHQKMLVARLCSTELAATRASFRILIVEDSTINVKVLAATLKRAGFTNMHVAVNGQLAVDYYRERRGQSQGQSADAPPPAPHAAPVDPVCDLILMDCEMPVLDGWAATQQLRALGCHTPVFALTANATAASQHRCLESGMELFLNKPLSSHDLLLSIAAIAPFHFYPLAYCPHVLLPSAFASSLVGQDA